VEILLKIVEREADPQAWFMLASSYLELGQYDEAFRHASAAVEGEPSSAPSQRSTCKSESCSGRLRFRVVGLQHPGRPSVANSVRHRLISIRFRHTSPCAISNSWTTF